MWTTTFRYLNSCLRAAIDTRLMFQGDPLEVIFVQGLLLKWQEKVLTLAVSFADAH